MDFCLLLKTWVKVSKYGQKFIDSAKTFTADAIKTASKRAIQKTAEATGDDLIGNKIADKITSISKKSSNNNDNNNNDDGVELRTNKKDIYLQEKDSKLLMN